MSEKSEITISNFLTYNDSLLEEMKSESPELSKAMGSVINALFTKYAVVTDEPDEPTSKDDSKIYFKIIWSEGTNAKNEVFQTLEDIQTKIKKYGMTSTPNSTYIKTKLGVYETLNGNEQELIDFRVDVGQAKGDYDYNKISLRNYLFTQLDGIFESIMKYSGFQYSLSQTFYNTFAKRKSDRLIFEAKNGERSQFFLKSLNSVQSMGPDSYSKLAGKYTYKVEFDKLNDFSGNPFMIDSVGQISFTSEQITKLLDGKAISPTELTDLSKENSAWALNYWSKGTIQLASEKTNNTHSPEPDNDDSLVYPTDYPQPSVNTGNRKGPTQSASDYYKKLNDLGFEYGDLTADKYTPNNILFFVTGNDDKRYTLKMDKNKVVRWSGVPSLTTPDQVDENRVNFFAVTSDKLKSMTFIELNALLDEKKETMSIFTSDEPEYVELEMEIDDIEAEMINRKNKK
jgi:archaellum component FlaG (FlaF/FlaG flagellin family)